MSKRVKASDPFANVVPTRAGLVPQPPLALATCVSYGWQGEVAEYGLMLWDGKSKGTVHNVANLSRDHKPVVVYVAPTRKFRTIKTVEDLKGLLAQGDSGSVDRIVSELH